MLILENQHPLAILSINVVVLIKELFKNFRKKPIKWEKDLSNMLGFLINLRLKDKEVLPLIFPFGSFKLSNIILPLSMLQDIEILLRI